MFSIKISSESDLYATATAADMERYNVNAPRSCSSTGGFFVGLYAEVECCKDGHMDKKTKIRLLLS